jgi:hypothetical protein
LLPANELDVLFWKIETGFDTKPKVNQLRLQGLYLSGKSTG